MTDGMHFLGGSQSPLSEHVEHLLHQGEAGLDAAVIELAAKTGEVMREVLTDQHGPGPHRDHSKDGRGGGQDLVESVTVSKPSFYGSGVREFVGPLAFYARFLEKGWTPHGRGSADQRAGSKAVRRTTAQRRKVDGKGRVSFPFIEEVESRVREQISEAANTVVRFLT